MKNFIRFVFFLTISSWNTYGIAQSLDRIVAVVNDGVITQSQLVQKVQLERQQLQASGQSVPAEKIFRNQVLQHMIDTELQLQLAKKLGITVTDKDVDHAITEIAKRNGLSLAEFQEKLKQQSFNYDKYRAQIREQMLVGELEHRSVGGKILINDQEIKQFANKLRNQPVTKSTNTFYHIEDLLIPLPDNASAEQIAAAERTAQTLLVKARAGSSFQELVQKTEPKNSLSGGDLGWRPLKGLPDIFAKAVQTLRQGEISKPLQAPNGFHLIKLVAVRGSDMQQSAHDAITTHARHILIKTTPLTDDAQVRARLAEVRADIMRGGDFAKLASEYSQDPGSATKGGDLGWMQPGTLDPQFETAMNQLKPGQISEPVKSQFGWHIIEVIERKTSKNDQAYLQNQAQQMLYQQKFQEAVQEWLKKLRKQSYVKIMD